MYSLRLHGKRSVELQKLLNLRDVSPLQVGRKGKTFTVSYLVDSMGFSKKLIESILRKVSSSKAKGDPDSILNLLRSHGFTDPQITRIIKAYPRSLIEDSEEFLALKLQCLQSRAASTSELTEISLKADKEKMIRNLRVLRELAVPEKLFFSRLMFGDKQSVCCGIKIFEESVKEVVDMGFVPTTSKFVHTQHAVRSFEVEDVWAMFKKWPKFLTYSEDKITRKFEILNECGLVQDEVCSVFKKFPQCMGLSEKSIANSIETFLGLGFSRDEFAMMVKRVPSAIGLSPVLVKLKSEFLVKKMNWPIQALVSNPQVLGYSMEKRIVPRCNVITALMSKGLIGSELPSMSCVLVCTYEAFLNKY
ncbi:hypothetical protein EUTSA_v10024039mg [Eutrema salsugineum]|uniref:Mitochondrial transcription termination factor family protein n=1 Tax=Eutrema salsugineum TaxID=72664 RepID=V4KH29_EUTSA|nr:hypothetical protein EUTSA_v10024039mg [Eutrema salsugineum]